MAIMAPGLTVMGQPMASWIVTIVLVSRCEIRYEPPLNVPTSSNVAPAPVNCPGGGAPPGIDDWRLKDSCLGLANAV